MDLLPSYTYRRILYIVVLVRFNFCVQVHVMILWVYNRLTSMGKKSPFITTFKNNHVSFFRSRLFLNPQTQARGYVCSK